MFSTPGCRIAGCALHIAMRQPLQSSQQKRACQSAHDAGQRNFKSESVQHEPEENQVCRNPDSRFHGKGPAPSNRSRRSALHAGTVPRDACGVQSILVQNTQYGTN
jgi:hypothetical protein